MKKSEMNMKKSVILLGLAAMASAFTGCSKDVDAGVSGNVDNMPAAQSGVLVANVPGGETRLALGEDGVSTTWSEGDRIGLYSATPANKLIAFDIMSENVGSSSATFVVNDLDAIAWDQATLLAESAPVSLDNQVVAIYPYDGALVESPMGDYAQMLRVGGTIPSTQNYVENSFDPAAMPMIAMTTRTEGTTGPDTFDPMTFVHLGAMLKLPLTSPEAVTLDKIVVSGPLMAGTAYIDFSTGVSQTVLDALQNGTSLGLPDGYFGAANYESKITVNGPIEVNPDGVTDVYIAILANKYSSMGSGISFSFYKDGEAEPFASRSTNLRDVKGGELVAIQSLSLGAGETPVLTLDNLDPKLVMWQELKDVKSLTLTLTQNEKVVYSGNLDPTATSVNIGDLPLSSVIAQGEVNFTLDVEYASAFGASASTTLTLFSAIIPAPILSVNGNVVTISNANAGYDEIAWAYLDGAGVTDENQFSGFTTEGINNGAIDLSSLTPGDYSVCVRGNVGGFLGSNVSTCVDVTVTEYTGPTYDVEISASMEGKVLTITVTKGADIVQGYMDAYNLMALISGTEIGLYDGWTVDQQSISVDLTDNLNWGDIEEGVNTISLGAYPEGQWSASPISNEVSVNIE